MSKLDTAVAKAVYENAKTALHSLNYTLIRCNAGREQDLGWVYSALNLLKGLIAEDGGSGGNDPVIEKAIMDCGPGMTKITKVLGLPEVLAQLAEEAAELSQAALKLRRALDKRNPTPVSAAEADRALQEEFADVLLCMSMVGVERRIVEPTIRAKSARWATRLENGGASND